MQRRDVDNFYGSNFEADFVNIQYNGKLDPIKVVTDKTLSKKFRPKILVEDKPVDYFLARGDIPLEHFTPIEFQDDDGRTTLLGLKMAPENVRKAAEQKWEIEISKDMPIPTLVSLIKAAHLSLFEILGYRYALSAGGHFVGRTILGEFFLRNCDTPKPRVLENALPFFREFATMVRPAQVSEHNLQGTITDGLLFMCRDGRGSPWALIVCMRTSESLHFVMIPILDHPDKAARFIGFLRDQRGHLEGTLCQFDQGQWKVDNKSTNLFWPKEGVLYP